MAEAPEWTEEGCWLAVKREAVQPIYRCVKHGVTQGAEIDDPSNRVLGHSRGKRLIQRLHPITLQEQGLGEVDGDFCRC